MVLYDKESKKQPEEVPAQAGATMAANLNPQNPTISFTVTGSNLKVVGAVIGDNNPIVQSDSLEKKKDSTVRIYGPTELANLQKQVKRKIGELEISGVNNPYNVFFEKYEGEYLNKTAQPDELAGILCTLGVLTANDKNDVKSESTNNEKNKIIYRVVKREKKIDELITALGQIGDNATLNLIDRTASS